MADEEWHRDAGGADQRFRRAVLGKLALDVEEDACDPKQASVAEDPVRRGALFLLFADSGVGADGGVLQITPASTNPLSPIASSVT
ncbi:hypothetical protein [Bradyrhizobium australiense]|uniref:Uncharacterized protein n=1 Tax=Bradyrhizobium australiense TaxID=2721161 RepID=A0A7Y4GZ30_9BRAD|nr:hypothetical protein [Bradyrhizobium australiense]NOJ44628.1 hypothetical protein [Bradyrhizobium australiense]